MALALLVVSSSYAAVVAQTFRMVGGVRHQLDHGRLYEVDDAVVSVRLKPGGGDLTDLLASVAPQLGALSLRRQNLLGVIDLVLPTGLDPVLAVSRLRATGQVEFATVNTQGDWFGDPEESAQWHLHNAGQAGGLAGADVGAAAAWALHTGDPSVTVAVIDSGVDLFHADLVPNLFAHGDEHPANGIDDDGNGFIDDVHGYDFGNDDGDPTGSFWHGTAVAGVVAAQGGNGIDGASLGGGAASGGGCRVLSIAVGDLSPQGAVIDDAIVYAVQSGAQVINLSLSIGSSPAIDAALTWARDVHDVLIVGASGNNASLVLYPSDHPSVFAVASSDRHDLVSSFSAPGKEVRLAAPGEEILTTMLGGGTTTVSGTSFAAPQVAAAAALMLSLDPHLSADALSEALQQTAHDLPPQGSDQASGSGRLDAAAALQSIDPSSAGSATPYGSGLAGVSNQVPVIKAPQGPPELGASDFKLRVSKARKGSPAWLVLGVAPANLAFHGGSLLVDPTGPWILLVKDTSVVFGSPFGQASVTLPIPQDPGFAGLGLSAQWIVSDAAAILGFSMTSGLALTVGN